MKRLLSKLVAAVNDARTAKAVDRAEPGLRTPTYAVKTPGTHESITLPKLRTFDHPPTPDESRAEGRRVAFEYARARSGKPHLSWKQAKRLLDQWEKEERKLERVSRRAD